MIREGIKKGRSVKTGGIRELVGCAGLLAAVFVAVTGCVNPAPIVKQLERAADKAAKVVEDARNVADRDCPKATAVCSVYFEAVKTGLVPDDERAELACAKTASVCALLGAGGAGD